MRIHTGLAAALLLLLFPLAAAGDDVPCAVSPTNVTFGSVDVGDTASVVLTVTNYTISSMLINVWLSQSYSPTPNFSMTGGGSDITFSPGETKEVTLYFHPSKEGLFSCQITTNAYGAGNCGSVSCNGTGYRVCNQLSSSQGFGEVVVGQSRTQTFAVYGIEGRTVRGRVSMEHSAEFHVVSGGGDFTIGPGEYHEVAVEFTPYAIGYIEGVLQTGIACGDFRLTGTGVPETQPRPNPDAGITFHVRPRVEDPVCPGSVVRELGPCSGYATSGETGPGAAYDVYVVLTGGDPAHGFAGADFGIDYNGHPQAGVDVDGWIFCGALQYPTPNWPAADEGNLVTWNHETDCQTELAPGHQALGVHALVGVLSVEAYSMDVMQIVPRPYVLNQGPHVSDCAAQVNQVLPSSRWGKALFTVDGSVPGCNPCRENCSEPVRALCEAYPEKVFFGMVPSGAQVDTTVYVLNPFPFPLTGEVGEDSDAFSIVAGEGPFTIEPGQILPITVRYTGTTGPVESVLRIDPFCDGILLNGGERLPHSEEQYVPVTVTAMSADWEGEAASVRWRTGDLVRGAVFTVYRQTAAGGERRGLMGSPARDGTDYTFMDEGAPRQGAQYWLSMAAPDGNTTWYGPIPLAARPFSLILEANHPNPFLSQTAMSFEVPSPGRVVLSVYDLAGREVSRLLDRDLPAGRFDASWDGRDSQGGMAPSGIYLLRLVTVDGVKSRKIARIG